MERDGMPINTTITYNGLNLFCSGPGRISPGEITSRAAITQTPDATGTTVISQGLEPRAITQHGTLIADSAGQLQSLISRIEHYVGQGDATLVDENAKPWPHCVMRRFETNNPRRVGPRHAVDYTIAYLQAKP